MQINIEIHYIDSIDKKHIELPTNHILPTLKIDTKKVVMVKVLNQFINQKDLTNVLFNVNDEQYLALDKIHNRIFWHPFYYSKNDVDYVYNNRYTDFISVRDVFYDIHEAQRVNWTNTAWPLIKNNNYDIGAFGDSITAGHDLPNKTSWCYVLAEKDNSTLANFGLGGLGSEGIWYNLITAYKNIKFKKIYIVFPTLERYLYKAEKFGFYFKIPISPSGTQLAYRDDNIWFSREEIMEILNEYKQEVIKENNVTKSKHFIKKIKDFLTENTINFYVSSWDSDCYKFIQTVFEGKNILPKFNENSNNKKSAVGDHPHQSIHKEWVDSFYKKD